jgi:Tol biopolymer transport system component
MEADGSRQKQMSFDEANNWFPHISPDGKKVVYLAYRRGDVDPGAHPADKDVQIKMMTSRGGRPEVLFSLFGGQGTINVNSWSPDSRRFAFVSYELVKP